MSALGLLDWTRAASFSAGALAKLVLLRLSSGAGGRLHRGDLPARRDADGHRARVRHAPSPSRSPQWCTRRRTSSPAITSPRRQVTAHSGLELLQGTLQVFAHAGRDRGRLPGADCGRCAARPGARRDRQHRRLHRPARRLGVGDAGDARADATAARCTARVPAQPLRRLRRLAGARLDRRCWRCRVWRFYQRRSARCRATPSPAA